MKACVLHEPRPIEQRPLDCRDIDRPVVSSGSVLLRIRACGICRTDLHVVEGDLPRRKLPVVPGHQIVGEVVALGSGTEGPPPGSRVGVPWLHQTCGQCRFCRRGQENLCDVPAFTGWTVDGGFAEFAVAPAEFLYPLPEGFPDLQAAPLLCAGIIGYRSLGLTGLDARGWAGARLGIHGFGAAGHVCIQLARARGAEVYVCTRDAHHRDLATQLGASWVGEASARPPKPLDASIVFAPAGELVPPALRALDKGGVLVLGGIHMSPIPELPYALLYHERVIRSVANNTRDDGRRFLQEAARIPVETRVTTFPLSQANEALAALKHDGFQGAGVLVP